MLLIFQQVDNCLIVEKRSSGKYELVTFVKVRQLNKKN